MSEKIIVDDPQKEIVGVKYAVAKKIQKALENGRRYFGSSAASLTHQVSDPAMAGKGIKPELAKIGLEGERDTTSFLKKWMKDKPNAVLIDSVHVRGWGKEIVNEETGFVDNGDTDHVMLIGNEVLLIDSKRWKGKKAYTVGEKGEILRTGKSFPGGKVHMPQAVHLWLDYLEADASITGIICINNDEVKVFRNRNWYTQRFFRLVEIDRFKELLDDKYNDYISNEDKHHINTTLVSQVVVSAVKPFDSYSRVFDMDTLHNFK